MERSIRRARLTSSTFDKVIQSLKDDGTLNKLSTKFLAAYFGVDPAKVPYLKP